MRSASRLLCSVLGGPAWEEAALMRLVGTVKSAAANVEGGPGPVRRWSLGQQTQKETKSCRAWGGGGEWRELE